MHTNTSVRPHYRKTKDGEWVVCGPVREIQADYQVVVHKRDGTTKMEMIERVGKAFSMDGVQCRYGYITARHGGHGQRIPRCERCRACGGDGQVEQSLGECAACGAEYDC